MINTDKFILTPTEAASKLGCSTQTVYKYIHMGILKAYRDPGHRSLQIFITDLYDCLETLKCLREPAMPSKCN